MATKIIKEKWTKDKILVVERNSVSGKIKITYDGVVFGKVDKRCYKANIDGEPLYATVSGNEFKGIEVLIFGHSVTIVPPMAWYEYGVAILIMIPSVLFGALGGALGALSAYLCIAIMRKIPNVVLKLIIGLVVGGVCVMGIIAIIGSIGALIAPALQ